MFERFTDRARQTVVLAQEEARLLDHNYIGTEHLLLGLLAIPEGVAARALHRVNIDTDAVRHDVVEIVGRGAASPSGHIPFTPRAKKVLELSLREAMKLHHNYIGTEHILLGLVREGEGVAAQILVKRAADLERVRGAVVAELHRAGSEPQLRGPARTPAAEGALAAARELAASGPVGSHHLLEALARSEGSAAGKVLASLGVDLDALSAAIDEVGIEGTTDVTAVESAARKMQLRVEGDEVHLVLRDETTLASARAIAEQLGDADAAAGPLVGLWQAIATELDQLARRVAPEPAGAAADVGRGIILRAAIQSRLARRRPR